MNTCKNCIYRVYDDVFGVFKCKIYNHKIKDVYKYIDCESHEKKGAERDDSSGR
jgi:hypothetical protein